MRPMRADLWAMASAARLWSKHHRRIVVIGGLACLFILFEVGIRHVPPDGMTYTMQYHLDTELPPSQLASMGIDMGPTTTIYSDSQQQRFVSDWYEALNEGPIVPSPLFQAGCMALPGYYTYIATFTWHDIPVQSWSGGPCPDFMLNSGGVPNIFWGHTFPNGQPIEASPGFYPQP